MPHFMNTLRALLAEVETTDPRKAARLAWLRETAAAWREANRKVCAAWDRVLDGLPDDLGDEELEALNLPDPPEQREVDALHAQLKAVIDHDRWPRHLYWGDM